MNCFNIWDFDNTLYFNPQNDFTGEINLKNFCNFYIEFEDAINTLITGRHQSQRDMIINACKQRNYFFQSCSFLPFSLQVYQRNDFMDIYRQWKIDEIISHMKILSDELTLQNSYIRVFDDDLEILKRIAMRIYDEDIDTTKIFLRHVTLSDFSEISRENRIYKSIWRVK